MANEKRLIDANAVYEGLLAERKSLCPPFDNYAIGYCDAIQRVRNAPTVDAVEVVHGRWIYEPVEFTYEKDIKCSICGNYAEHASNYCPNCGAKMDGGNDDGG